MIQNAYHAFLSLYTLCEGKLREGIPIPPSPPPHTHHPRERTIPRSSTGLSRYYYYY